MNWRVVYKVISRANSKYPFYEGKFSYADLETSKIARKIPKQRVGWGRRAVEMRANKTHFDRFENDTIGLNEVFNELRGPEAFNKLKEDLLVCGVGFLALAGDRVMPFSALEATGTYDWREQNLKDGVAIYREYTNMNRNSVNAPDSYVQYKPDVTISVDGNSVTQTANVTGRPLMTLLTYRSTVKQPFGRTVLSAPARDAMIEASRTVRQATIAGYHYNVKVDVILGADSETEVDTIKSQTGDVLKIGANDNGQIPQIGQFAQHALAPFNDSILIAARNFCTETKLNLSNLNISTSAAPTSPEELEIVGDDLRDDITEWQKEVGEQLKHFAVTLWMNKNGVTKLDANLQQKINAIKVAWLPIFKPDVSKFGDGLNKIADKAPVIVKQRSIWRNLGLTSREIDDVIDNIPESDDNKTS